MLKFITDHGTAILSLLPIAASMWLVYFTDRLQRKRAIHEGRIATMKEAVRRSRIIHFLKPDDPNWTEIVNETMDWIDVNGPMLTKRGSQALGDVYLWKTLSHTIGRADTRHFFYNAQLGWEVLRDELAYLMNGRSIIERLRRAWRKMRGRVKERNPNPVANPLPER